jgi:hypothetical protein
MRSPISRIGLVVGIGAALSGAPGAALVGCKDPTQILLDVRTDLPCSAARGTGIAAGAPGTVERAPFAVESRDCSEGGAIGTLVVTPESSNDADVGFRVVLGVDVDSSACTADNGYKGCIVQRRQVRYLPHTPIQLPFDMLRVCKGVPCDEQSTCASSGVCIPSRIPDPEECVPPKRCYPPGDPGGSPPDGGAMEAGADAVADADASKPPITVNGRLFGSVAGAGIDVVVTDARGIDKTAKTNTDGFFTITDVVPPYDVYYAQGMNHTLYDQLSTSAPVLAQVKTGFTVASAPIRYAGAVPDQPTDGPNSVVFVAPTTTGLRNAFLKDRTTGPSTGTLFGGTANDSNYFYANGTTTFPFDVYFLRMTLTSGDPPVPASYDGFGVATGVTATVGANPLATVPAIAVSDPMERQALGSFTVPPGFVPQLRTLYLVKGPDLAIVLYAGSVSAADMSFAIKYPVLAGYTLAFCVQAQHAVTADYTNACRGGIPMTSSVFPDLHLVDAPKLVAPVQGAVGVQRRPTVSFTASGNQRFKVRIGEGTNNVAWTIITARTTVTIPANRPALTPQANYSFGVNALAPFDTIDDAIKPGAEGYDRDRYETQPADSSFQTGL